LSVPTLFVKVDLAAKVARAMELRKIREKRATKLRAPQERIRRRQNISYKGVEIFLGYDPRIGVCNLCRAVRDFDCITTVMHHDLYDDSDPLTHTIELCVKCHYKQHHIQRPTIQKEKCPIRNPHNPYMLYQL